MSSDEVSEEDFEEPFVASLLHADTPLYNFGWEDFWPRNYVEGRKFGCLSRVRFGDWQFVPNPDDEYGDQYWMRFSHYGVIHCAANILTAEDRDDLADGEFERGYFVRLGTTKVDGNVTELWAIQSGVLPGSDYTLLSRAPGDDLASEFAVLQIRCPAEFWRDAEPLDSWITDYCVINSRAEMLTFAKAMLAYPPMGILSSVPPVEETTDGTKTSEN